MKKIISILLALAIILCVQGTGFAADEKQSSPDFVVTPMFVNISYVACSLSVSGGIASMGSMFSLYQDMDRVRMAEYLQKYDGGWTTIKSYSQNFYDTDWGSWGASYAVASGYNYRLYCYYYIYSGGVLVESTSCVDYYYY
jgi:hypothetical protein